MVKTKNLMEPDVLLNAGLLIGSVGGALFLGDFLSGVTAAIPAGLGSLLVAAGSGMKLWKKFA